jgi:hypothetical protein
VNPSAAKKGTSFKGLVQYLIHDPEQAESSERVAFTHTLNMMTDDPEKAAKVMAWTAEHAADLKQAAGIKATGRKLAEPVYHLSLNWDPSENPDKAEMIEAARQALKVLNAEDHEALLVAHMEKNHKHLHIALNRVHPTKGTVFKDGKDFERLQEWAYQYEKARGKVFCLERAIKYEKDPILKAHYKAQLAEREKEGNAPQQGKPRPEWEAEQEARRDKSAKAQQIREEQAQKTAELAKRGRAMHERQKEERSTLWGARCAAVQKLKDEQKTQTAALTAEIKEENAEEWQKLLAQQKEDRKTFRAQEWKQLKKARKSLKIVTGTKVSAHTPDYRGHMAVVFNYTAMLKAKEFEATIKQQRAAFWQTRRNRADARFADLFKRQNEERQQLSGDYKGRIEATKEAHAAEREDMKQAWAQRNAERKQAWAEYSGQRERQKPANQNRGTFRGEWEAARRADTRPQGNERTESRQPETSRGRDRGFTR